jgi:hypothetical protein
VKAGFEPMPLLSPEWVTRFRPVLRGSRVVAAAALDCRVNVTVQATPWLTPVGLRVRARHGALRWDVGRIRLEDAHVRLSYAMFVLCWCERSLAPAVDAVTANRPDVRATGRIGELALLAHSPFPAEDPDVLALLARGTLVPPIDELRAQMRSAAEAQADAHPATEAQGRVRHPAAEAHG